MCFSAEVSFGASAVITIVGVVAYKKARKTPYRLLAVIPLIFGVQQFLEGIVWVSSIHEEYANLLQLSTYGFIVTAWIVWPFLLPYTMFKIEKDPIRKKIMLALVVVGGFVISILTYVLISTGVKAEIVDCSIWYNYGQNQPSNSLFGVIYLSTTVLPFLFSKIGKVWVLGVINLATYFVTRIYFNDRVISVWCFFGALASIVILLIIIDINRINKKID